MMASTVASRVGAMYSLVGRGAQAAVTGAALRSAVAVVAGMGPSRSSVWTAAAAGRPSAAWTVSSPCSAAFSTAAEPVEDDDMELPENLTLHAPEDFFDTETLPYLEDEVKEVPIVKFGEPGATTGTTVLDNRIFGVPLREDLVHRVVQWQLAKRRTKVYKTKTRSEVSGGGRKPWSQKGTGRARQGSIRAPHWKGGGVAHGPKIRDWSQKLPKKVRAAGLRVALAAKYRDRRLVVVDTLDTEFFRTQDMATLMEEHGWDEHRCLFIDGPEFPDNFLQASNNLKRVNPLPVQGANVFDILKMDMLIITTTGLHLLNQRLIDDSIPVTAAPATNA